MIMDSQMKVRNSYMYSQKKLLPVGEENFAYIRRNNLYYVDKTQLIEKLLTNWGKANLFTRPRRFGKSLNMSMLKNFFEIGCDKQLFDGLYIAQKQEICEKYMGRFPVVSMSLKSVEASSFDGAKQMLAKIVNEEARRLQFLLQSSELTDIDKKVFLSLLDENMPESTLVYSIRELTELLCKHYGKAVIVLIDEYDVPLAKANENHYYDKMVGLIRGLFANVIKTNDNLQFAVLTGCLRVAKESIFTGLNNFKVHSLTSVAFDEYFGFTDAEVKEMLRYYDQSDQYDIVKDWYDGYRFGNVDVYCPWDVICYISDHVEEPEKEPDNYNIRTGLVICSVILFFVGILWLNENLAKIEDDGRYTYYAALLYWVFILIGSLLLKPLKSKSVKFVTALSVYNLVVFLVIVFHNYSNIQYLVELRRYRLCAVIPEGYRGIRSTLDFFVTMAYYSRGILFIAILLFMIEYIPKFPYKKAANIGLYSYITFLILHMITACQLTDSMYFGLYEHNVVLWNNIAYQLEIFPGYLVQMILWEGDEEFPPSSQILFSDNFPVSFAAEDMAVMGDVIIGSLKAFLKCL